MIKKRVTDLNRLERNINKRVKIIATPTGIRDLDNFVRSLIAPSKFKKLVMQDNELVIITGQKSREKANLIGKNKTKLKNLAALLEDFFGIKKVIVR